ncbi:unnamed protein product [Arctogadus glacialis]
MSRMRETELEMELATRPSQDCEEGLEGVEEGCLVWSEPTDRCCYRCGAWRPNNVQLRRDEGETRMRGKKGLFVWEVLTLTPTPKLVFSAVLTTPAPLHNVSRQTNDWPDPHLT